MSRPIRISYDGAIYHVMNRGQNRQKIFYSTTDYLKFLEILERSTEMWNVKIHAISLMPNHYHLLLETPDGNISRVMRHINAVYTQWFNKKSSRDGPLFKGRFKSSLVEEGAYLVELLRYIHLNPVKAKIVKKAQDHKWTSHAPYMKNLKEWKWLTTDRLLSFFGDNLIQARKKLNEFVLEKISKEFEQRLSSQNWPSVLGSESFERLIEWNFVKDMDNREVKYVTYQKKKLTLSQIKKIICNELGCQWNHIKKPSNRAEQHYRHLAIAAIQRELRLKHKELEKVFSTMQPSTVSRAVNSVSKKHPALWELLVANLENAKSKT